MQLLLSKTFLSKLENIIAETDFTIRYSKGSFKSNHCVLKDQKLIVLNKYLSTEGRISTLVTLLTSDALDHKSIKPQSLKILEKFKNNL